MLVSSQDMPYIPTHITVDLSSKTISVSIYNLPIFCCFLQWRRITIALCIKHCQAMKQIPTHCHTKSKSVYGRLAARLESQLALGSD